MPLLSNWGWKPNVNGIGLEARPYSNGQDGNPENGPNPRGRWKQNGDRLETDRGGEPHGVASSDTSTDRESLGKGGSGMSDERRGKGKGPSSSHGQDHEDGLLGNEKECRTSDMKDCGGINQDHGHDLSETGDDQNPTLNPKGGKASGRRKNSNAAKALDQRPSLFLQGQLFAILVAMAL